MDNNLNKIKYMSKKKTLYRSVITLEVISEEPIPENMTLGDIHEECDNGSYSGITDYLFKNKPIKGMRAVALVEQQGSAPEFFQMDSKGNDISEDDE
jgi:hypothetical protein